ncbi:MAG: cupin domain-containing protein [Phyllobacterium sp.]|uniref:cupin domain-containing protein n=1 Tax=Phyllobacterium sp. TaxID=1871046 RepID=UPI0030F36464
MRILASVCFCAALVALPAAAADKPHNAKVTVVFDHKLPNVPGKSMRGVLVEYGPGGSNPSHTHAKSAFIYATVIQGRIKSQINDGKVKVYNTGENWIEVPGDHHRVSANASETEPAKILAVFVVDTDETQLTKPDE